MALTGIADDAESPFGSIAIRNHHVLEFAAKEVLDERLAFRVDFNEIGQNSQRRPIQSTDVIEKLLDGFATVRTVNGQFADRLKPMADTLFLILGLCGNLYGFGMLHFQARIILTVLYFVIVAPFALIVRFAADPLSIKRHAQQGWRAKAEPKGSHMNRALNQF